MIRWSSDVGAPVAVMAVNVVGRTVFPQYYDWLTYGMTAIGYGAAMLNMGGDFVKNIGVASLPLTAEKIYDRVSGGLAPVSKRLGMRKVSRYPAPAYQAPYAAGYPNETIKLT